MNRWLEKIAEGADIVPMKPTEPSFVGYVGTSTGTFDEKNDDAAPTTASEWGDWVVERCPLLPEDRSHIARGLYRLHPRIQQRLAERYAEAWHAAANDESTCHKRDNAGRRAANLIITKLLKDNILEVDQ